MVTRVQTDGPGLEFREKMRLGGGGGGQCDVYSMGGLSLGVWASRFGLERWLPPWSGWVDLCLIITHLSLGFCGKRAL